MAGDVKFKKRVLFVGIPDMAYIGLDGLLAVGVNIVGVIGPKAEHNTCLAFREFVLARGLNFIENEDLRSPAFAAKIKALNADIAVVCSFNYKIPKVLLEAVKDGFLNLHPSLLPKYRGGNPYFHQIVNNESSSGVTIHFMDEGFDTGDIVVQKVVPMNETETMGTLFNRTNFLGVEMLIETLKKYENEPLPRTKQPAGEFVSGAGLKDNELFIDYAQNALKLERVVRALNPFLIAKTIFRGNIIQIFIAEAVEDKSANRFHPGEIAKIEGGKVFVAAADGFFVPKVLQFGSFFIGGSEEFVRIANPQIGEIFL